MAEPGFITQDEILEEEESCISEIVRETGLKSKSNPTFTDLNVIAEPADSHLIRLSELKFCAATPGQISGLQSTFAALSSNTEDNIETFSSTTGVISSNCKSLKIDFANGEYANSVSVGSDTTGLRYIKITTNQDNELVIGRIVSSVDFN